MLSRIAALPNLSYLGELPIEKVNQEIAQSDVFVNTSAGEGFPNTFVQAWLRGVPVVSCFVDPDGCLSRAGAGIFAGDAKRLPALISELQADRPRLRALGAVAESYALEHHGPAGAQKLVDLLLRCAAERTLPASSLGTKRA